MKNQRKFTSRTKLVNERQLSLGRVFEETPKAVFAAIAFSAYEQLGFTAEEIPARIAAEWIALFGNGQVESRPTKFISDFASKHDPLAE